MALQLQTFKNFTPAMYAAFAAKIKNDTGVVVEAVTDSVPNPSGEVVHGSFTFDYGYDSEAQVLQVQCKHKPLFIPAAMIVNGMAEEIAEIIAVSKVPVSNVVVSGPTV